MDLLIFLWILPCAYIFFSVIFFVFPSLLHKKKITHFKAFNIAHRGGSGEGVENTIGAFKNALQNGSEMLEMDVHLTKDQQVVVVHDWNFERTANSMAILRETNYKDLPQYNRNIPLVFSKAYTVPLLADKVDRKIPLLSEVFDTFPQTPMNIDIKIDDSTLIKMVSAMIRERGREKITIWGSFNQQTTNKCLEENPDIPLFCSLSRVVLLTVFFYTGLLPFVPIREEYLEIPCFGAQTFNSLLPRGTSLRIIIFLANFLLMNRLFFWHLRSRGVKLYVWVLNEEDDFDLAMSFNIQGVMTDYPSKLYYFFNKRHPASPRSSLLPSNNSASPNRPNATPRRTASK